MHPGLVRSLVTPTILTVRREPVPKLRGEIAAHQWLSPDHVLSDQLARVGGLVQHHRRQNSVYRTLLDQAGWGGTAPESMADLDSLPVIGKSEIAMMTAELSLPRVSLGRYTARLSGGSTGQPTVVYAPPLSNAASLAAREVCQGWYGIQPGDRQIRLWGRRLDSARWRSGVKDFLLNRIRLDSLALEYDRIEETVGRIRRFGSDYIYGYASMIDLLVRRVADRDGAHPFQGLKATISTSETLLPGQRARLERVLGCPVVNEYGCSEVDIIAFECPAGGYHVIAANVLVEVKRFGNEPEGYGQVVVTDLRNTMTPVIRYQLGDLARMRSTACSCGRGWPCLDGILGRSQGQYIKTPAGRVVHSQFLVYVLEELVLNGMPLGRFKIVQKEDYGLVIRVSPRGSEPLDAATIAKAVKDACLPTLGKECAVSVVTVDEMEFEAERANKFHHFESRIDDSC